MRDGELITMTGPVPNLTLRPPSNLKGTESSTKVMHWAEHLRATEMKKEQTSLIQPVVFSHLPIAQRHPLGTLQEEGREWEQERSQKAEGPQWLLLSLGGQY